MVVLDTLSRRTGRVVRFVNVIDCNGAGLGHRKVLSYAKEFSGGGGGNAVPIWASAIYIVGVNMIAAGIIITAKAAFFNEVQKRRTNIVSGDPFRRSRVFTERFNRAAMPVGVGGELSAGNDGHCCVGVAHTALTDDEGTFSRLYSTHL